MENGLQKVMMETQGRGDRNGPGRRHGDREGDKVQSNSGHNSRARGFADGLAKRWKGTAEQRALQHLTRLGGPDGWCQDVWCTQALIQAPSSHLLPSSGKPIPLECILLVPWLLITLLREETTPTPTQGTAGRAAQSLREGEKY